MTQPVLTVRRPSFIEAVLCCRRKRCRLIKKNLKIYIGVFISLFNSAFSITMLFPFLPFMVEFLLPQIDPASIGKYAGIIASSMFFGRFTGSYIWGMLSDSWGRRPVLIISTILLGLSSLSFGFSVNFAMAVCTRFMVGLTNGLVGTIKAALSESSTDETQPIGLSILATAFGVGIIIGPAVSGAIADPISQYNLNITNTAVRNFLTQFPYSLPGVINFLLCILATFYLIIFFPETLQKKKSSEKMESHDQFSETSVSSGANHTHTSTMNEDEEGHEDGIMETSLSSDRHEAQTDNEDVEIKTKVKQKRRRSFVLSIIPGRRDSMSLQFIKIPRVVIKKNKREKRQYNHLTLQEECEDIKEESLINQDNEERLIDQDDDQERLIDQDDDQERLIDQDDDQERLIDQDDDQERLIDQDDDQERLIDQDDDQERLIDQDDDQERLIDQDDDQERLIDQDDDQERLIDQDDDQERLINQDNDQERLIDQDDNQERLIDHDKQKTTKFTKVWFMKKLISFRSGLIKAFKNLKFFFKNPVTRLVLLIYCIYSFAVIGFDEVYSLWCATPGYLGGLGFSLHEIGISLSIVGALLLPFTLFFYPFLERKMGSINTFYLMTMIQIFFTLLLPSIHYLTTLDQSLVLWFTLCTVMLIIRIAISVDFAITSLFINNSVTFDKVGAINGLAMSMTSLFRCASPTFAGSIFSVSLSLTSKNIGYLIDYHLIYIILGIILLITLIMATRLPNSINRQKSVLEDNV